MKISKIVGLVVITALLSCQDKPKVIVADTTTPSAAAAPAPTTEAGGNAMTPPDASAFHKVTAKEVKQGKKYTYMLVEENGQAYWIATAKMEATEGTNYFYRGGLKKTNFESVEFKKTFDEITLVSQIIDEKSHPGSQGASAAQATGSGILNKMNDKMQHNHSEVAEAPLDPAALKNAIKLSTVLGKPSAYKSQTVIVKGKVVKVNNQIMGRNWVHIQDGTSFNGQAADLTITTNDIVQIGNEVAFKGKIAVDKDFGAGYSYAVIMEEAIKQ